MFSKHGLRIEEKAEVMWLRPKRKELEIHLNGKKLTQSDSFVYLSGRICDGNSDTEIRRRTRAGQMIGGKSTG